MDPRMYFPSEYRQEKQQRYRGVDTSRRLLQITRRRKKDFDLRRLVEDTLVPPDRQFFA